MNEEARAGHNPQAQNRWPRYYALYRKAMDRHIAYLKERGIPYTVATADEAMAWWLSDPEPQEPKEQLAFPGIMEER